MSEPPAKPSPRNEASTTQSLGPLRDAQDSPQDRAVRTDSSHCTEIFARLSRRRSPYDRYELEREVARGGQGVVLQVWDEDLRRALAMKVVQAHPEDESPDPDSVDERTLGRFLEEAQVSGQLDHPGIVPVHELGVDDKGLAYFTMKLVKGGDLRDIFEHVHDGVQGWTQTRALGVILKVCEAMAYAHHKGVIHRDLKPTNVMVGRFGAVYVMDWGVARILGHKDTRDRRIREPELTTATVRSHRSDTRRTGAADAQLMTMDGDVVGTPAYMSPEQAKGQLDLVGPAADIYSVGAMLYHLLSGQIPYVPDDAVVNNYAVWGMLQQGPPMPVSQLAPSVPAELVAICEKAMAREIADRYASMEELGEDLHAYIEGRVVHAYEEGALAELRKWVRRNRPLALSLAAAMVLAVAGLTTLSVVEAKNAERGRAVMQLSAVVQLEELQNRSEELWPPHPDKLPEFEAWLDDARALVAGLEEDPNDGGPGHRAQLAQLRERALPASGDSSLRSEFAGDQDQWWHGQLSALVAALEDLEDELPGDTKAARDSGWSVAARRDFAASIEHRSVTGADAVERWRRARAAILADPIYAGLDLAPQLGLLPIGTDPDSGLWEFWHLMSGDEPRRHESGRLVLEEASGLVLVLLPGGTFRMGAQSELPDGHNYDPNAGPDEAPVHLVALPPFFLSKYEVTQAQWERLHGENPSTHYDAQDVSNAGGRPFSRLHPVESVTWYECRRAVQRLDLRLPTEAEWEYAARAGTTTPWWTGADPAALHDAANLLDQYLEGTAARYRGAPWNDGEAIHAPVGTFRANPFGLHDTAGNVMEWCMDNYLDNFYATSPGRDPLYEDPTDATGAERRVGRGGGYNDRYTLARSADRESGRADHRGAATGLRPARGVDTE